MLEPSERFPTKSRSHVRRASCPAFKSMEVNKEVNFPVSPTESNSCYDNWVTCLLKDLSSIVEVPEEDAGITALKTKHKNRESSVF